MVEILILVVLIINTILLISIHSKFEPKNYGEYVYRKDKQESDEK